MKSNDLSPDVVLMAEVQDLLSPLLMQQPQAPTATTQDISPTAIAGAGVNGVLVGTLLALVDDGLTPLVRYVDGTDAHTSKARSVVDLHGPHIGRPVVLMFEGGDPLRPLVMGVVRQPQAWPDAAPPPQVKVDADGERLIVSAAEQLVLRCGKSSITLTKAGRVVIRGVHVSSVSEGANRVSGGSVHLN